MKYSKITIHLVFIFYFSINFGLYSKPNQIDFSKEQPIHPYYQTLNEANSLDCKEKQLCIQNCSDGSVAIITNKYTNKQNVRLACISECSKIICTKQNK
ncbi:hypothetical protein EHQ49_16660 [Leptospira perdikensis]|uniref:Uncharacterized protein n=1 Tax=Leptospira perdikensis TaxID=2484948 RepID=A0A4R9JCW9_9LEPT|nr:hypothetical protein EHQ49_16660 [Leptospira perdikensis]